jgi:chorismate lyase/3-hydroxybenzoate synthase
VTGERQHGFDGRAAAGGAGTIAPPISAITGDPPLWVAEWVGPAARSMVDAGAAELTPLTILRGTTWSHLSISVAGVRALPEARFESLVADAYGALARALAGERRHPVRFWNFIPGIHDPMASAPERYMVFNAGRFRAFEAWFGARDDAFARVVPTASSVGAGGDVLVMHCLASDAPGVHVENPRQRPSYTYSARYGPRPPSFARATIVERAGGRWVLAGGTASILGEDTFHDDIERQTAETLANLSALVEAACAASRASRTAPRDWLGLFRSLRVHVVRAGDADAVLQAVRARFPELETLELYQTDLCRRDLLVEIEGVAAL